MNLSNIKNIGLPCPACKQLITKDVYEKARSQKRQNALRSLEKAKQNGTKMGKKPTLDFKEVEKLRSKYLKWTEIAKILGVSRSYLSKASSMRGIK